MSINSRFQNNHIKNPDARDLIQPIERDISFLYHQLSNYSYIMGDLPFNEYYSLPYLDFVNYKFPLPDAELSFIKEGCLILILTMAWEQIDNAGCYINDKINKIINQLEIFEPLNEKQNMLHDIVTLTVTFAKKPNKEQYGDIKEKSNWVHREFIRGYFINKANEFNTNPYYKNE